MEINYSELQNNYNNIDDKVNKLMQVFVDLKDKMKLHYNMIEENKNKFIEADHKIDELEIKYCNNSKETKDNNNNILKTENFLKKFKSNVTQDILEIKSSENEKTRIINKNKSDISNLKNTNDSIVNKINNQDEINSSVNSSYNNLNELIVTNLNNLEQHINNYNDKVSKISENNENIDKLKKEIGLHLNEYSTNKKKINELLSLFQNSISSLNDSNTKNSEDISENINSLHKYIEKFNSKLSKINNYFSDNNKAIDEINSKINSNTSKISNQVTINDNVISRFNNINDLIESTSTDLLNFSNKCSIDIQQLSDNFTSKMNTNKELVNNNKINLNKCNEEINKINKYIKDNIVLIEKINNVLRANSSKMENQATINSQVNNKFNNINNLIESNTNNIEGHMIEYMRERSELVSKINSNITKLENQNNFNTKIKNLYENINNLVENNNVKFTKHLTEYNKEKEKINSSININTRKLDNQTNINSKVNSMFNNINNLIEDNKSNISNHLISYNSDIDKIKKKLLDNSSRLDNQFSFNNTTNTHLKNLSKYMENNKVKINNLITLTSEIESINSKINTNIGKLDNQVNLNRQVNNTFSNINKLIEDVSNKLDNLNKENSHSLNKLKTDLSNRMDNHLKDYNSNIIRINNNKESIEQINNLNITTTSLLEELDDAIKSNILKIDNQNIVNNKFKSSLLNLSNAIEKNQNEIVDNNNKINVSISNLDTSINEKLNTHVEEYNTNMINIENVLNQNKNVFSVIDNKISELDVTINNNSKLASKNEQSILDYNDNFNRQIREINDKILVEKKLNQKLFNNIDFPDKLHQKTLIDFRISEGKNNFLNFHSNDDVPKQTEINNCMIINKTMPANLSLIDFSVEDNHHSITSNNVSNEIHLSNDYLLFIIIPPEMKLDEDISKIKVNVKNFNLDKEINIKQFDCIRFEYSDKRNIFVFNVKMNMMYQGYYQHAIISLLVNGYTLFEFKRYPYNYDTTPYLPTIHGSKYHYHIKPGKISNNVNLTLPELEEDDSFVLKMTPQTLHNKKLIFLADEKIKIRKKNLIDICKIIKRLNPVEYYRNIHNSIKHTNVTNDKLKTEYEYETGMLAQEIRMIPEMKHLVTEDENTGLLSLDYYGMIPFLIQATKEIIKNNESYEKRLISVENDSKVNKANIERLMRFNKN